MVLKLLDLFMPSHRHWGARAKVRRVVAAAFPFASTATIDLTTRALRPTGDPDNGDVRVALVQGRRVVIPYRLAFEVRHRASGKIQGDAALMLQCLCTRHSDGHVRQQALQRILRECHAWLVPFVVLLAGEYVKEIADDLVAALPGLDRTLYGSFVCENRSFVAFLKARSISYWDCYYRKQYPEKNDYPGIVFLDQLERWAAEMPA